MTFRIMTLNIMPLSITTFSVATLRITPPITCMLSAIMWHSKRHYSELHIWCYYAECHCVECRHNDCRGATKTVSWGLYSKFFLLRQVMHWCNKLVCLSLTDTLACSYIWRQSKSLHKKSPYHMATRSGLNKLVCLSLKDIWSVLIFECNLRTRTKSCPLSW